MSGGRSDNKTKPGDASVAAFVDGVAHEGRRADARILLDLMSRVTGAEPRMWGDTIIGYGQYHYRYDSGREGDFFLTGFSPRKASMSVYIMPGFKPYQDHLARLGPHKHSVSCLYLGRLGRIDLDVLAEIVSDSIERMRARYPDARL
ncbi:DUF1801 domain-containing protein [Oricola sp.]|uniref:DUF1801 domain-containing protein n=1 Tax=Oricola sp. TaxID=1979950 RepID=UPI003BA90E11